MVLFSCSFWLMLHVLYLKCPTKVLFFRGGAWREEAAHWGCDLKEYYVVVGSSLCTILPGRGWATFFHWALLLCFCLQATMDWPYVCHFKFCKVNSTIQHTFFVCARDFLYFVLFYFLKQGLAMCLRLALSLLCSVCWPWTCKSLPAQPRESSGHIL